MNGRANVKLPGLPSLLSAANLISLGRVVLAPVILVLLARATETTLYWALGIACLAAASDVVDGYVARRRGASEIGRYVDAASDAIFNLAVFLGFLANAWLAAFWFATIYFAEVVVPYLGTFAKQMRQPFAVRWSARLKTSLHPIAQIAVIAAALAFPEGSERAQIMTLALGAAVAASLIYVLDHAVFTALRAAQRADGRA